MPCKTMVFYCKKPPRANSLASKMHMTFRTVFIILLKLRPTLPSLIRMDIFRHKRRSAPSILWNSLFCPCLIDTLFLNLNLLRKEQPSGMRKVILLNLPINLSNFVQSIGFFFVKSSNIELKSRTRSFEFTEGW